ncbi:MAG: EAL domain-containing protein [Betaproteobacteria bacterium]|nr:EAL domain-containing protein [Betaproteobacteria bacterium]
MMIQKLDLVLARLGVSQRSDAINLIAVAIALVIAGAVLTFFEMRSLRISLHDDLQAQAQIVGDNAQAALAFGDRKNATEILSALRASPTVIDAIIYDNREQPFAVYQRQPSAGHASTHPLTGQEHFSLDHIDVVHPVQYSEGELGSVQVRGSLRLVYSRLAGFIGTTAVTGLLAMGVAYLLISGLRTAVRRAEEQLTYLAHYDPVTNLLNRHTFNERLDFALARAKRFHSSVGLLLLDLDNFKSVNDSQGHQAGDALLHSVGERLTKVLRRADAVCRLGGDEFAVILENPADKQAANLVAKALVDKLGKPYVIESREVYSTVSCGIAFYPDHASDAPSLVRNADTAMYHAKDAGRNCFQVFKEEMNQSTMRRLNIENSLRKALQNGEFRLSFQPKVNVQQNRVVGAEALLRWENPELGKVSPAEFIPIAEESNLIISIGEWVLREACHQAMVWEQQGLGALTVSVNLSARQFEDNHLLKRVLSSLRESGLPPDRLELELTESILMENVESHIRVLNELFSIGVKLSIDDFGTGYSFMGYLKRFPIDTLKIDRTFIRGLPQDKEDAAITQAIIVLAHALGLAVVAEGAETIEQKNFLRQYGCDIIQGYVFSPPLPVEAFAQWVRKKGIAPAGDDGDEEALSQLELG